MNGKLLTYGFALWIVGTIGVRFGGQFLLRPGSAGATLILYLASVLAMAVVTRRLCRAAALPRHQWPAGAVVLALPTLLLDPLSSAFFARVFPNITPAAAGLFGGWMLCCCAGALLGATIGATTGTAASDPVRPAAETVRQEAPRGIGR